MISKLKIKLFLIFFLLLVFNSFSDILVDTNIAKDIPLKKDTLQNITDSNSLKLKESKQSFEGNNKVSTIPSNIIDSTKLFIKKPYFSFGVGFLLGSNDLFSKWQQALPDSVNKIIPITPLSWKLIIKEPVNSYNISFPFRVSYYPFIFDKTSIGIDGFLVYFGKSFNAQLNKDSLSGSLFYTQSLNTFSLSLGIIYKYELNEKYFSIDGTNKTNFVLGAYFLPLYFISKKISIKSNNAPDSIVTSAQTLCENIKANAFGGSFRVGISSQKILSKNSGLEFSLSYVGNYIGNFWGDKVIYKKEINSLWQNPQEKISFISHSIELGVLFCF
jgi:hypothetical protein